jgi:hypothetical protein
MSIPPPVHPLAEDTAQFLVECFGTEAARILTAMQVAFGNKDFVRGLEAYCFVHDTTWHEDAQVMCLREGQRKVALMLQSVASIHVNDVTQTTQGETP